MRLLLPWMSVGVCAVSLSGCFKVGDDDSGGGQGGQAGEQGTTGGTHSSGGTAGSSLAGSSTGPGGSSGVGGSSAGTSDRAGNGGDRAGGGAGGAKETTGGGAGKAPSGGKGGSSGKGGTGGGSGKAGSAAGGAAGHGNPPTTPGTCQGYSDKLEACKVTNGPTDCELWGADPKRLCEYGCYEQADCGKIADRACFSVTSSLDDCVQACQGFTCDDGSLLPLSYACDGFDDCSGGEDEKGCLICDGYPIEADYICDGFDDCSDASDEANCPVEPTFKCTDGYTVRGSYRCDGAADCSDGSDEAGCPLLTCTRPTAPQAGLACENAAANLTSCGLLPGGVMTSCTDRTEYRACEKTCYAEASCSDISDLFCSDVSSSSSPVRQCLAGCAPLSDAFPCKTGDAVVPGSALCDSYSDCSDGSDEVGCIFSCGTDAGTIPEYETCDGTNDCPNGIDETGCGPTCGAAL